KKEKTLCIHSPGNWKDASVGGRVISREEMAKPNFKNPSGVRREEAGKVCKTSALFQKFIFEKLHEVAKEHEFDKYNLTMEATHHGPLIEKPCIFVEIGSTIDEWKNSRAGFVIAKTIHKTIQEFKENKYHEIAFAIGGPHYCPNLNKIQLKSNVAISHVIPQYALPLTDEMVKEAVEKTEEEIDFAVLDWKGLGNAESRKQIIEILDKNYVSYKKVSEIKK
ncbi:MAG: D-aminoacyl-tRNA deacylase, partial [Nanoarchaeota archaeon]